MNPILTIPFSRCGSICLLWAACAVLLLVLGKRFSPKKISLWEIVRSEEGAAYSLNLAILTPFYTLLVCLLIELTLLLNVQIGVDYAAFAAARSAVVWVTAEQTSQSTRDDLKGMVELAAIHALAPYASSLKKHVRSSTGTSNSNEQYYDAYYAMSADPSRQTRTYSSRKYNYAADGTRVEFDPPLTDILSNHPGAIEVTVTFERPFNIPGVGRFLGRNSSSGIGYVRDLTATVPIQLEWPKTEDHRMGFEYDSRPAGGMN